MADHRRHLRLARRHVAEAEERVNAQQARVDSLLASQSDRISLFLAEKVLHSLQTTLDVMRQHLTTEEDIERTRRSDPALALHHLWIARSSGDRRIPSP